MNGGKPKRAPARAVGRPGTDPSSRRAQRSREAELEILVDEPLVLDRVGRVTLKPAADPGPPPTEHDLEEMLVWMRKLRANLRDRGVIR